MNEEIKRVLLIEDNPSDVRVVQKLLSKAKDVRYEFECVERLSQAEEILGKKDIDIVLLDLVLPDIRGIEAFLNLHKKAPNVPIIILSALTDEKQALEAVKNGAQDYIIKGELNNYTLSRSMLYAIERKKAECALKEIRQELEVQAWGLKKTNEGIKLLYKELENKNKELKELDSLKSDFVSTVSHELCTPLATMKEYASLILDKTAGDVTKEQKEYLDIIVSNINRLSRMIDNLLDISKIEAGRIQAQKTLVEITALAKYVIAALRPEMEKKRLRYKTLFHTPLPDLYVDPDRIIQIFTNLVGNAIKFTPENGQITVEIKDKDRDVECSVSDTGTGIAPEDIDKLFERFRQLGPENGARNKGAGLGLAITKELVKMHNGRIWVESTPDKGSKFIFTLPKYTADAFFREYIFNGMRETVKKGSRMSLIVVSVSGFGRLKQRMPDADIRSLLRDMEEILRQGLRREGDIAQRDTGEIAVILANCGKEDALKVEQRLKELLREYLSGHGLRDAVELRFGCATYPDEADDGEELIKKAKG